MDLKIEGKLDGAPNILIESENSIKLTRGQKGAYGWEIKMYGLNTNAILRNIEATDGKLRKNYGGVENGNSKDTNVA